MNLTENKGIDLYWDNVGGKILDIALIVAKPKARIVVCGRLSAFSEKYSI